LCPARTTSASAPLRQEPSASISGGGHDALDTPVDLTDADVDDIEITLTDRGTEIIGSVRDGRLLQMPGAAVIVMSAHDRQWTPNRTRYLRASTAGSFIITGCLRASI
jgi:hypothetical protein